MTSHRWVNPLELLLLGAIWGAAFLFMRVAAPEFGPFPLVLMRLALGTLVLLPFLLREWTAIPRDQWGLLLLIAMLNSAVPFLGFAWASQHSPAGVIAIANSTTSLFAALIAFVAFRERVGMLRSVALLAGIAGVIVLMGDDTEQMNVTDGALAGILAAFCFALSAVLIKRYLEALPPVALAGLTLGMGLVLAAPVAAVTWPETPISMQAWVSALLLGVLCTGVAYGLYFRLIRRVGASRAVTVTFLVPVFAVLWAWWLLDEPFTLRMAVAAALILGSVAISQRSQRQQPERQPAQDADGVRRE